MPWTTPKTWSVGAALPAAELNTYVRDNLNAVGPTISRARKTADESVTSSTTLQDDNHLLFAIGVSEIWMAEASLYYTSGTTGDLKFAWSVPSGATGTHSYVGFDISIVFNSDVSTTLSTPLSVGGSGAIRLAQLRAIIVNSTNAGNVTLQWAQNVSDGTATTVLTNSVLLAHRIT
jgi:hypothetical protein